MKLKSAFLATTAILSAGNAFASDVEVYGQVNKLIMGADNGVESNTAIVDNDASSTRFGFKAQKQLENGMVVSGLLELQSESNSSYSVTMDDDNNEENSGITERHSRIGLGTKYGTFLIGKTSEATDGIAEIDLGGVQDVMYSDITSIGGGILFTESATSNATTKSIKDLYSNFDGNRTNLVRYDSPIINGVSASTSISSGGDLAVAAKYTTKVANMVKVKAGLGYKKHEVSSTVNDEIVGSVSALHEATGLAATVAMGERSFDSNNQDSNFMYTKLSYLPVGSNFEYAVDYSKAEAVDTANSNADLKSYGLGGQYNIAEGVSTSVMYRQIKADDLAASVNDIKIMTAGLKVKF
jgi:hypothetical protein